MKKLFVLPLIVLATIIPTVLQAHRIAIVVSVNHDAITGKLLEGATACLYKNGIKPEDVSIAYVPGSFEIPLTVKLLAETRKFEAIICVGAILTAGNPQWSYTADHVSKNIGSVSLDFNVPVTWGILLCDSNDQAEEMVHHLEKNKGWEAAQAAITMIGLTKQIKQFSQT